MKKTGVVLLVIIVLMAAVCSVAEESSDKKGMLMPSLGYFLRRYPDQETDGEDGLTETYINVSESEFEAFGEYLLESGAEISEQSLADSSFSASICMGEGTIRIIYNVKTLDANLVYPAGTYNEWTGFANKQYEKMEKLIQQGKIDDAIAAYNEIPENGKYLKGIELLLVAQNAQLPQETEAPTGDPWLGVGVAFADENTWQQKGIPVGAYLAGITKNSPAEKCGLKVGDIILEFNDVVIKSQEDMANAFSGLSVGQKITVWVWRPEIVKNAEGFDISSEGKYIDPLEITIESKP